MWEAGDFGVASGGTGNDSAFLLKAATSSLPAFSTPVAIKVADVLITSAKEDGNF